jgi:hypothetical protein
MNGRVYDYNLGRFMSVDPFIQSPTSTQSVNPYSYIMNNSLAGTDPTGYMGCAASRIESSCDCTLSRYGGNGKADASSFGGNKSGGSRSNGSSAAGSKPTQTAQNINSVGSLQQNAGKQNQSYGNDANFAKDDGTNVGGTPSPKGTGYFGGAGLDGEYVQDMAKALGEAGIENVFAMDGSGLSATQQVDALVGYLALSDKMEGFPHSLKLPNGESGQLNLIGYSFGSLVAAQFAAKYADAGIKVDNLVLIGSPISSKFLKQLRSNPNIGNVSVKNLSQHGDPIHAGMSTYQAFKALPTLMSQDSSGNGSGHFYYRPDSQVGQQRRRSLAKELYGEGLR